MNHNYRTYAASRQRRLFMYIYPHCLRCFPLLFLIVPFVIFAAIADRIYIVSRRGALQKKEKFQKVTLSAQER
jgi:hypothetical protein